MRLLTLEQAQPTTEDVVFEQQALPPLFGALAFLAVSVGCIIGLFNADGLYQTIGLILGAALFLIGSLVAFSCFRKALLPTNWLVALGPDRMLIKFRSHLNTDLPSTDPQVAQLPLAGIKAARITRQQITEYTRPNLPRDKSHSSSSLVFLDIFVAGVDLTALKQRLKYEHAVRPEEFEMGVISKGKSGHYPVSIRTNKFIRIEWSSPETQIIPRIKKAVAILQSFGVAIAEPHNEALDYTNLGLEQGDIAEKLLHLIERGRSMQARSFLRKVHDYSPEQADRLVKLLAERSAL
jgi:hypothetical protein